MVKRWKLYAQEAYECVIHMPIVLAGPAAIAGVVYGVPWAVITIVRRVW